MLRIAKLGADGAGYYLRSVGPEPPGSWLGRGPAAAGLGGEVAGAHLEALLHGRDPGTGELLGTARHRVRVAAFDLTFAAPKSVSLLHGLADQELSETVAVSHVVAVGAAVGYVEERALGVRRTAGSQRCVEPVDGAFCASFVHRTSRALDPHLHSHVVLANLGGDQEGRFSALDGRGIYAHAGAAGALYHVQLRRELTQRLGVEWNSPDRGRADLAGIGREPIREFSRRSAEIAADLAASGHAGHRAADYAALKTREPKELSVAYEDLRDGWRRRAVEVGLGPRRLEAVVERNTFSVGATRDLSADPERVVARLAAAGRPVARRNVVQAWCLESRAGEAVSRVLENADSLLGRLSRALPGAPAVTGQERDGPGVTERRLPLESLELDPMARRLAEIASERRLLVRRGLERGMEAVRAPSKQRAQETGIGFGL